MRGHKKKAKLIRYLKVTKRKIRKINRAKILLWINKNLKQHPFILGILFLVWISYITQPLFYALNIKALLKFHLKLHAIIIAAWFILVILSNALKDKQRVKWYFKKRFVFSLLLLFPPLGLIFLWLGAQFKRITKVILTIMFGSLLVIGQIYSAKEHVKFERMTYFDRIIEMINKPKKKIALQALNKDVLDSLQFAPRPSRKGAAKLEATEIASLCSPGIVSIKTKDKDGREIGLGSGFIISSDGIIVTNFHVLESAYQAEVKIKDELFREVYLISSDPQLDIAFLKVNAKNLSPLAIGDSDSLVNGQSIVVLGNPWGLERSVSTGVISAVRAKDKIKLIQMTAPVSPGSSGGPVINEYGEVVGITTLASFFMSQNLNFAIPINYLKKVISEKK